MMCNIRKFRIGFTALTVVTAYVLISFFIEHSSPYSAKSAVANYSDFLNNHDGSNKSCDRNENLVDIAKSAKSCIPSLIETARLAQSLTTIPEWETLNVPTRVPLTTKTSTSQANDTKKKSQLQQSSILPFYLEDSSVLIDRIMALLLIRILAIISVRAERQTTTPIQSLIDKDGNDENGILNLPFFDDLSTSTICHKLLTTSTTTNNEWEWPESMTPEFMCELKEYVSSIVCEHYNDVLYHNRDHMYHVVISANKLLDLLLCEYDYCYQRQSSTTLDLQPEINHDTTTTTNNINKEEEKEGTDNHKKYGDDNNMSSNPSLLSSNKQAFQPPAYGIRKDPLLHFTFLFSAFIHDVDHRGVTNHQLIHEGNDLANLFSNDESVAERRSLDVAFSLLNKPCYDTLRGLLFPKKNNEDKSEEEGDNDSTYMRFQSTVIDLVLTTDIASKERAGKTMSKWKEAFGEEQHLVKEEGLQTHVQEQQHGKKDFEQPNDLKKIVVLEQMLKAADVSAIFQGWETFFSSLQRLFEEQKVAFNAKRGNDPIPQLFHNQISFIENYASPLVQRLEKTGVFQEDVTKMFRKILEQNKQRWLKEGSSIITEIFEVIDGLETLIKKDSL